MSRTTAPAPETFPPVALDLDDFARIRLQEAWQMVSTHADEPILCDHIRVAADAVASQQVVIAFGGHWSAGKSTLINALLGRDLLPVSERTETGAACRIRAGAVDHALAIRAHGPITFPCTQAALAEQISITGGGSEPRAAVAAVEAVELTLSGAPLPPNVWWVDTPGLNDAPEAERRLRLEIDRADQLLWVLNPDQFLSEVEQRFLADHVARRGVASIALLINVRTHQHPESDWRRFQNEGWPAHRAKIARFWDLAGAPEASRPPVLVASGAHLRAEFGAARLIQFLAGADDVLARRVISARVTALMSVITAVSSEIAHRAREAELRAEQRRIAQAEQDRRLATFRSAATANILEVLAGVREPLRAIGAQVAARYGSSSAQVEAMIATQLRSEMHRLLVERWDAVVAGLGDAAFRAGIGAPAAEVIAMVAADVAVPPIAIPLPAVAPSGGCANGLWGCAGPITVLMLLLAAAAETAGPILIALIMCAVVWMIVSSEANRQRARDLPRRIDDAILAAAAAHAARVHVAVDRATSAYATNSGSNPHP